MRLFFIVFLLLGTVLAAVNVEQKTADKALESFLSYKDATAEFSLNYCEKVTENGSYFFLYHLNPTGFVLIAQDSDLEPVLGYSFSNSFASESGEKGIINFWLNHYQQEMLSNLSSNITEVNNKLWEEGYSQKDRFQQWPEEGSTTTGGWVVTNWTQSPPYNNMCPLDPENGNRSIAGCPSIAMGQILNFHREINNTQFSNSDDYRQYSSGITNCYIDDDAEECDFPAFPELNTYLAAIENLYNGEDQPDDQMKSALVFACGVAIKQSYSSSVSGNYYDQQVVNAYRRFGFSNSSLLWETSPCLYERIAENVKTALPSQICVVQPAGGGHQIVIDGYNTDEEYHFNFGWGGQSNGWYSFPLSGMPLQLNIFNSIVLDINQEWTDCPDFTINTPIPGELISDNLLTYEISAATGIDIVSYKVFIDDTLINEPTVDGTYSQYLANYTNGFHKLTVIGFSEDSKMKVEEIQFEIARGDVVFSEDFDYNWLGTWELDSFNQGFTWQPLDNSLEHFSQINQGSMCSATCPVAYDIIDEKIISPEISLPQAENLLLSFYAAFCDMYLQFPNLSLEISTDGGTSWSPLWQATEPGFNWRWRAVNVDLTEYAGQSVKLQFYTGGFSYADVSVDHLRIYDLSNVDAEDNSISNLSIVCIYPNPFSYSDNNRKGTGATIRFSLKESSNVQASVYNIKGQLVKQIFSGKKESGEHYLSWNGYNESNTQACSGVYLIRIKTDYESQTSKLMILK